MIGNVKRGRAALVVLLALAFVVLSFLLLRRVREPVYQGKALSEWLLLRGVIGSERRQAIWEIGSNAAPFMARWVQYDMEPWRKAVLKAAPQFSILREPQMLADASVQGFKIIGSKGASAIPELTRLMRGTNEVVALRALRSVEGIGRDGLRVPFDIRTNGYSYNRSLLARSSWQIRRILESPFVYVALLKCLQNTDPEIAGAAATALGEIGPEPGVVKALTNVVEVWNGHVRCCAVEALGRLGADSIPAVPCLVRGLSDDDVQVRKAATNSLRRLSRETMGVVKEP